MNLRGYLYNTYMGPKMYVFEISKEESSQGSNCSLLLGKLMKVSFMFFHQICGGCSFRSSRDRSSHTRDRERSLSQEPCKEGGGAGEGWRDDRVDYGDWEDRGRSTSPDTARGRERERSLSLERDRRSSSEERESGEI